MNDRLLDTEDITDMFEAAIEHNTKERDKSVSDLLVERSEDWNTEYLSMMRHPRAFPIGTFREGLGGEMRELVYESRSLRPGQVRHFRRFSPVHGASTELEFVQGHEKGVLPKVTLKHLWRGKSDHAACPNKVYLTDAYKGLDPRQFLVVVERIHDSWIGVMEERRKTMAKEKKTTRKKSQDKSKEKKITRKKSQDKSVAL